MTRRIRIGIQLVGPQLADPAAAARLSEQAGFDIVMVAGHTPHEYAATGIVRADGPLRKLRLLESAGIIRRLVDGETIDHSGDHYRLSGMGKTQPDGHNHAVDWSAARLDAQLAAVSDGIGDDARLVDLSALVQAVEAFAPVTAALRADTGTA